MARSGFEARAITRPTPTAPMAAVAIAPAWITPTSPGSALGKSKSATKPATSKTMAKRSNKRSMTTVANAAEPLIDSRRAKIYGLSTSPTRPGSNALAAYPIVVALAALSNDVCPIGFSRYPPSLDPQREAQRRESQGQKQHVALGGAHGRPHLTELSVPKEEPHQTDGQCADQKGSEMTLHQQRCRSHGVGTRELAGTTAKECTTTLRWSSLLAKLCFFHPTFKEVRSCTRQRRSSKPS